MKITEVTKPNQLKANSRTPKVIKPSKGHESRNVTRGKLVGEVKKPQMPKSRNPVASHAQSSGSGVHQDQFKKNRPDRKQKHKGKVFNVDEARSKRLDFNFTPEDLHKLQQIDDLDKMKKVALRLIANKDSSRPMEPKKVAWFDSALDQKNSKEEVIKMMWHLLLSGEGHKVIGDRYSTTKNSYRVAMGEGVVVISKPSDLMAMLDTLLKSWKGKEHSDQEFEELINALGYTYKKEGDRVEIRPDR